MAPTVELQKPTNIQTQQGSGKNAEKTKRNFFLGCVEFTALLCVGLFALEAFCNFAGVGNEEFLEPDPVLGIRHIAGKKVVWRLEGYSDESLSSQGLRDREHNVQKPANVYRIALLGDSATEGMQVALNKTYGSQLEELLNKQSGLKGKQVEVLNFGCSSYSNGQEMLQLEQKVAPFQPDLVVLMYNRGDYIENIRDPSTLKAEPRPYYYLGADGSLQQDNTIMEFNKDGFKPQPVIDFLRRNSRIYGVLSHMNLALSLNEMLYTKLRGTVLKMLPGSKTNWKRIDAPYTITDPWKVTEALFNRINESCKKQNARLMVVCFPNIVNDKIYSQQIADLEKMSAGGNFDYLDLTADYMHSKDPKALFLKYHFSNAGHELAARKIAAELLK